ncbi:MAG: hypothetical protein ACRENX_03910 [Candidatus Dormibacteria bacterium]
MSWERGRTEIEGLLDERRLSMVEPSSALGERLMDDAAHHLESARTLAPSDPTGAYQLAYDAARKAGAALLAPQGLRAASAGGHRAIQEAVEAQFNGPNGMLIFRRFSRMRRGRAEREYPDSDSPNTTTDDVAEATQWSAEIVAAARSVLDSGELSAYRR